MAKGQMRSNREKKKPKKSLADKQKAGQPSVFAQPTPGNSRPPSKSR